MDNVGRIVIVDDMLENRRLLANIIRKNTDYQVITANDGASVLKMFETQPLINPDLILLDVMMPRMSGFEVAKALKDMPASREIPIIFITALTDIESKVKAFEMGGVDYVSKPFHKSELISRIKVQIDLKRVSDDLKLKNKMLANEEEHLQYLVEEKTDKLEKITLAMVTALENVNLYNDTDTGNHIRRVSQYAEFFARHYGCSQEFIKRIRIYASLHDIGKVGIPQSLLKKPGDYDNNEFDRVKEHVLIGAKMLDAEGIDPMAKNIVLFHHERWDGKGYARGLAGNDIPLEARIVAISDVYDALTTKRVYKDIYIEKKADSMIISQKGKQFEPKLVDIYMANKEELISVKSFCKKSELQKKC